MKQFCSSHVALVGANINDNTKLQIVWRCGKFEQSQICAIKKYAEYHDKSLGFNNLFPISVLKQAKYVKVTFNIFQQMNKAATQIPSNINGKKFWDMFYVCCIDILCMVYRYFMFVFQNIEYK